MNWNLRTLRTRILSRAEVVEHFVPVHSELEHKTVEHFDLEHKTAEHMDPGPLQKLPFLEPFALPNVALFSLVFCEISCATFI